jgi:protein-L-isoaspartate(D-aspartate) O-methyltransferase
MEETMKIVFFSILILSMCSAPLFAGSLEDSWKLKAAREKLVRNYVQPDGIKDPKVLAAMRNVPRHWFVPRDLESSAYKNRPLPIGEGQTISQPSIVALMTEILNLTGKERVLEIGTGSGYQAAILAEIVSEVYTLEIKTKLYKRTFNLFKLLNYNNIHIKHGDGYFGWPEAAPFDAIMITAAVDHIPPPLIQQLKDGGRLTLPLGNPFSYQNLVLVTKKGGDVSVKQVTGVMFVPMTGQALNR